MARSYVRAQKKRRGPLGPSPLAVSCAGSGRGYTSARKVPERRLAHGYRSVEVFRGGTGHLAGPPRAFVYCHQAVRVRAAGPSRGTCRPRGMARRLAPQDLDEQVGFVQGLGFSVWGYGRVVAQVGVQADGHGQGGKIVRFINRFLGKRHFTHQLSAICPSSLYYVFVTNAIVLGEIAVFFVYLAGTGACFAFTDRRAVSRSSARSPSCTASRSRPTGPRSGSRAR